MLTPAAFSGTRPWGSVLQNSQSEIIALNVMLILGRTGDTWRELSEEEYMAERIKDGARHYDVSQEISFFRRILPHVSSAYTASLFCKDWKGIYDQYLTMPEKGTPEYDQFLLQISTNA